jgi:predicted polyphosphate/ATP-dependent NAD kinase
LRLDDACFHQFAETPAEAPDISRELVERCKTEVRDFKSAASTGSADLIVVSSRWDEIGMAGLPHFARWVARNLSAELIVLGRTVEFDDVPRLLMKMRHLDPEDFPEIMAVRRNKDIDSLDAVRNPPVSAAL